MQDNELIIDGVLVRFAEDSIEENNSKDLEEILVDIISKMENDDK